MNAIIILAITGIIAMFLGVFKKKYLGLPVVLSASIITIIVILTGWSGDYSSIMHNMLLVDRFASVFSVTMIGVSIGIFFMCHYYYNQSIEHLTDLYALFVFSLTGGLMLVSFQNLVMLFVGTEILSIPLYILAASNRRNIASNEAGLKYYLMGSFATCFLLLGITFVYGATATFDMNEISILVNQNPAILPGLFNTGVLLILCALIFKISAVPFHFWAPDVYQGSPTVLTAYVSTVVKIAVFGAMIRFLHNFNLMTSDNMWFYLIAIVSVLTMIFGNILSIYQSNFKRLLAYSGIANAGFVLVAVASLNQATYEYILYYFAGYSVPTIILFTLYSTIKNQTGIDSLEGMKGLMQNNKLITLTMIVMLLSYIGIPPLAGFFGKYYILSNAVQAGNIWLMLIALVTSVLAAFNYLRIISYTVQQTNNAIPTIRIGKAYRSFLLAGIALVIIIGLAPDYFIDMMK
ncbi:MAG: NADH-quinone oxidoreductase subunit N [Saprospiraceae bacterium]|nr:NADH-quinone oxidoreductase subunit N [Saprospiraceae bacterium]